MGQILQQVQTGLAFKLIHSTMEEEFVKEMLGGYKEHTYDVDFPIIRDVFYDPHTMFHEAYSPSYLFGTISMWRNQNPDADFDSMTEENLNEVENELKYETWEFEEELFEDIMLVMNHFQMFYVNKPTVFHPISQNYSEISIEILHSPLQEVW